MQAGDGQRNTATVSVAITVIDVNERPIFGSGAAFSLAEHSTDVGTVVATDPDPADSVTGYSLSGTDAGLFSITSAGALSFSTAPDFENPQGGTDDDSNTYELTVTASGGSDSRALTATQSLTVTVTDGNDPPGAPTTRRINSSFVFNWDAPSDTGDSPGTGYYAEGHWVGEVNGRSQPIRAIRITINNPNTRSVSILLHGDDPPNNILVNGVRTSWTRVSMWVRAINAAGNGPNSSSVSRDR